MFSLIKDKYYTFMTIQIQKFGYGDKLDVFYFIQFFLQNLHLRWE